MNIPGSVSVPGAELVLRAGGVAPDRETTIIVNCAGRTRSIIGTQSLINAGLPNKVRALRNGTMGWTLARHVLEHGADRRGEIGLFEGARDNAREVAYRAGVRHLGPGEMAALQSDTHRTLYRFDVREAEEFTAGHLPGFAADERQRLLISARSQRRLEIFAPDDLVVVAQRLGPRRDGQAEPRKSTREVSVAG